MPTDQGHFSGGYKGSARRRHQRVSRHSGGTSGNLTVPGYQPRTPVRKYNPSAPRTPVQRQIRRDKAFLAPLREAVHAAYYQGTQPSQAGWKELQDTFGKPGVDLISKALVQRDAQMEGLKPDPIAEAAIGTIATAGVGGLANLLRGGGEAAVAEAEAQAAKAGATEAASQGSGTRAALGAALKGAAKKAAPVTDAIPQSVKSGAKVAARAASYPVRHPITSPLALEAPGALIHKDPGAFVRALEGKGVYGDLASGLAGTASHVSPLLGEAVSLPAAVLPSAFLGGKAALSAAKGHPDELNHLIEEWKATGILPALAEGDVGKAVHNLGDHPLYGGLEASGALNAAGRLAGAGARAIPGVDLASLERKPLPIEGTGIDVHREYSRDLLRQMIQRGVDQTPYGQRIKPDSWRGGKRLKEAANRFSSNQEAIRREHGRSDIEALKKILPRSGPTIKGHGKLDRKSAEIVNLAVERIVRHPETFHEDLAHYKDMLEAAAKETLPDGRPRLNKRELAANQALVKQIDAGIKRANPEHVVESANHFIDLQKPILEELVDLKLLTPEQAHKASAIPFARVWMGAGHDPALGVTDGAGQPLTLDQIHAEMDRMGVERPGFLSHRAPANADFYQPMFGGAMLEKGGRTGRAVAAGTQLGGVEALVRQLRRSRGLADRAKAWNKAIDRFGIEVKGVDTMAEAKRVMEDPGRYGLDRAIKPTPVPRHPFTAKKGEIEGALEHQSPALAEDAAGGALVRAIDEAGSGALPNDARVVFMPAKVVEQLRADANPVPSSVKGLQAATTLFKKAVLPWSPSFFVGNALDNTLRTILAGINPSHLYVGAKLHRALDEEQRAQLVAGAHYSSVEALAPHRSVEAVVTGQNKLARSARDLSEWSHKHGWKQAAVKVGPKAIGKLSRFLLTSNALISEVLPNYGALGKAVLKDARKTQGSWVKGITHLDEAVQSFAKGIEDPGKMIRVQKDLEEIYGNYTRMSPGARKFLSTAMPFWTWMRAAYKFVYLTMPAHHSIQTGLLASLANATRSEREQWGLSKEAPEHVPTYYQGIPLPNGEVLPLANYNSFDFASDPLTAVSNLSVPQIRNVVAAIEGRTWQGDEIKGEGHRVSAALWAAAGAFIPLINDLTEEGGQGQRHLAPHLSLPHVVSKEKIEKSRQPWEQISVPVESSSASSPAGGIDYGKVFSGSGGGSSVDYAKVFGGR